MSAYNNTSNASDGDSFDFEVVKTTGGVIFAVVLGIEMMLGLLMNLFIMLYSLCHLGMLKKSADVYLFGLSIVNFSTCAFVMPFPIITIGAEEWVFGKTIEQKEMACKISGWLFSTVNHQLIYVLAIISLDRFIFIVKPLFHKQHITRRAALIILASVWIIIPFYASTPFFGLREFVFSRDLYLCSTRDENIIHKVYSTVVILVPIGIILVTTIWTFIYTHQFLKNHQMLKQTQSVSDEAPNTRAEDHIYTRCIKQLFGFFSLLLIAQFVALGPITSLAVLRSVIPPMSIPSGILHTAVALFYTNNVANPLIQSHFQQDLKTMIKNCTAEKTN